MKRVLLPGLVILLLLGAWELAAQWDVIADALNIKPFLIPAPSDVAQMSSSRRGSETTGLASTSSTLASLRYRALGLFRPCLAFFTFTWAKSSSVAP